jgi:hypothetical protein
VTKFWWLAALLKIRIWLHQAYCSVRLGHEDELRLERDRLTLRCVSCGHESPGWRLDMPPPRVRGKKLIRFRKRLAA